ncbi:Sec23-binding domain of Sec16-domain-containing protein [Schizothecium vesticola]|uniref:Protein transport protein sec16 n=1 Tax=Schizothecium vesticola TaxID=314040 RepID=A0AA40F6J5_9PEZI|nr:Sec23-binding domain of Sec16-domain-containing protein [Schizothecium vesticola]
MLSDAPSASWHPAFRPNSTSELPRSPSQALPARPETPLHADDDEDDQVASNAESDAAEHLHNQSLGADAWFPDYSTGHGWTDDAGRATTTGDAHHEPSPSNSATPPEIKPSASPSKHASTMSFTRTVTSEVNWNDDEDPEWAASPPKGPDLFNFMPANERSNSFPPVPPLKEAAATEPETEQAPDHEPTTDAPQGTQEQETHGAFSTDPETFAAAFDDEEAGGNDDFFEHPIGGEVNGTAGDQQEERYAEGVPLIQSAGTDGLGNDGGKDAEDLFGDGDDAEDDFFIQTQVAEPPQASHPAGLERKSTFQVLDSLNVGEAEQPLDHLEGVAKEQSDSDAIPAQQGTDTSPPEAEAQPQETQEDLDEKWKAMFGEEVEEEGFLPDDDEGFLPDDDEPKVVDPAEFLGSDDEGLLDDDAEAPAQVPQPAPTVEAKPVNGRYLPPSVGSSAYAPVAPANPYLPAAPLGFQAPVASPYAVPSSAPPAPSVYGLARPPPAPEQNKPQSFVDRAKGGYTSPYDLPMEVVKPKLRPPTTSALRSTSTPSAPPPGVPPPARSSSMTSPVTPTAGAFGSFPPPSPKVPATTKPKEKFFEELPIVARPRPASRHSTATPPPASPFAPPPPPPAAAHVGAPHPSPLSYPPTSAHGLVAPPPLNPYAALQPSPGLVPSAQPAAPRYSPAPVGAPPLNSVAPPVAASRYSPAPPGARQVSGGHALPPPASAPPMLPHQPRTSSPLAHFEISHERSRAHGAHHSEGTLTEKRSVSSLYEARIQRVPSLPPTTEVEEEDASTPVRQSSGYFPNGQLASPESRYPQSPQRVRQTPPPPPTAHGQLNLSPPKRATSSHGLAGMAAAPQEFAPPPRSRTQSPGKLYGPRNGKPLEHSARPSTGHGPTHMQDTSYPVVAASPVTYAPTASSQPRGRSQTINYVPPTDGRERDPLQRWRGVPLISWGVGGTIVTMFPKDVPRYGISQALPSIIRSPGEVKILSAKDVQPLEERLTKFPGPLKGKSKKKETIAWLTSGIESLERDQPHNSLSPLHLSHDDKRAVERVLLWKILRVFVEHDGTLEGGPAVEKAVRDVLSPGPDSAIGVPPAYVTGGDVSRMNGSPATKMQSDAVDASAVEKIRQHLLDGESEKAIWAAADVRLWGHALLLANALSPDLYKQVSQEFIKKEVNSLGHKNESMAALYSVLSGNHDESVDELVPVHARAGLQLVAKDTASGVSQDAMQGLDKWRESLSLILSNRSNGDAQAIKSLGVLLASYGRAEAAHICFMFARTHAIFGGLDDPNSDFVLVGSDHKRQAEQFAKEIEPLLLSEVYEYGQSLAGGSNVAITNPHLAAYKLQHAYALAEYGYRDKALQYCEAISTAISSQTKRSPYYHAQLDVAVDDLMKRLRLAPKEESNSWITKPSMNKVSDSVWNRFNKFVAGDENESSGQGPDKDGEVAGPFGRIASGTPTISRPPSAHLETFGAAVPSFGMLPPTSSAPMMAPGPPTRAASRYAPGAAPASAPGANAYEPTSAYAPRSSMERTSSEMGRGSLDMPRQSSESQRGHPNPNPYSMNSPISPPQQGYTPYGVAPNAAQQLTSAMSPLPPGPLSTPAVSGYTPFGYSPAPVNGEAPADSPSQPEAADSQPGYQGPSYGYEAPSFSPYEAPSDDRNGKQNGVDENTEANSYEAPSYQPYGFEPPSYEPNGEPAAEDSGEESSKPKPKKKGIMYDDDDDDLPMPAIKPRDTSDKSKEDKDRENAEMFRKAAEEDAKRAAEAKQQGKKGWGFTSWFASGGSKKDMPEAGPAAGNPNKPIRAKLGEANSFFYDPEQKRWVNKNSDPKDSQAKTATPPPPKSIPRSVSASPASPASGPPMGGSAPTPSGFDAGRASAPPMGPPRSTMTPPPSEGGGFPSLAPPMMMRSASNTSTASAPAGRPTSRLSNSSSIDDLLGAAGPRKAGAKKPRKSARYVDVMTK